jgi:RND family efflux transporter MFP subunit
MKMKRCLALLSILAAGWVLAGCAEERKVVEQIRAIKTATATQIASGTERSFTGLVQATDSSVLSFEVGGLVARVNVDIGAGVEKGQVLAELDKESYSLKVKASRAELGRAKASRVRAEADYLREKNIFKEGAGSQKRLDQAKFAFDEAKAAVDYTASSLNLARRDLRKTVMAAPYAGTIGKRFVDPHTEVRSGEKIFEIDAAGTMEVLIGVPENVISRLGMGDDARVRFSSLPGRSVGGTIGHIGTVADAGNSFPVKVTLVDPPGEIYSGMSAEVTFLLEAKGGGSGYLLPASALLPGREPRTAHIFVYDPGSSTVSKRRIGLIGIQDNMAIVSEGIAAGEVVAAAGLSFLSEGQKVKLMAAKESAPPPDYIIK